MESCTEFSSVIDCTDDVRSDVLLLLQSGWACESSQYLARHAKERDYMFKKVSSEKRLMLLGAMRAYLVERLFKCAVIALHAQDDAIYEVPGSVNATSDYDVNILSRTAPDIMNFMLLNFYNLYSSTLLDAFDTNLYVVGRYSLKHARRDVPQIHLVSEKTFCLKPLTSEDIAISLAWACVGLSETVFASDNFAIKATLSRARTLKAQALSRFKSSSGTPQRIYETYKLYYEHCSAFYPMLYEQGFPLDDLIARVCEAGFYAVEAYLTPSTYNFVVLGMQVGFDLPMRPIEYIMAAIENYSHLSTHLSSELQSGNQNTAQVTLLKYSKYLHRIYYALYRATGDHILGERAQSINSEVVTKRNMDASKIDFTSMSYSPGQDIVNWKVDILRRLGTEVEVYWRGLEVGVAL